MASNSSNIEGAGGVLGAFDPVASARDYGVKLLHVCCLVENQRMQQLARKFEAELSCGSSHEWFARDAWVCNSDSGTCDPNCSRRAV